MEPTVSRYKWLYCKLPLSPINEKYILSTSGFLRALKWSVGAELISKALQPLVFVILARLLTPGDYGIMAAAVMVISFTQVFWESSMAKALIQWQGDVDEAANAGFWINLGMALFFALLLLVFADWLAEVLFQEAQVADVLRVMTVQLLLVAITSIHTALLQKEMKFNLLFWVKLSSVGVPAIISIPLAWHGYSYWALVACTLSGQATQLIVLWRINRWRPRFTFDTTIARHLVKFGGWVGVTGLFYWFYVWVDSFFVANYLGTTQMGLYRTGNHLVSMGYALLFAPLLPVIYSHFSSLKNGSDEIEQIFPRIIRAMTLVAIPIAFMIGALADPISVFIFGKNWKGVEFVLMVMALVHGYTWVVGANGEVYRAIGKPFYETIVDSILLVFHVLGYLIAIRHGFETFVWTRLGLSIFALILHIVLARLVIKISIAYFLKVIVLATFIGSVAPLVNWLARLWFNELIVQGVVTLLLSVVLMGVLLFLFERKGVIKDVLNLMHNRSSRCGPSTDLNKDHTHNPQQQNDLTEPA